MIETSKTTVVRTVCGFEDGSYCGILAHVKDGVLTKVEPADMPMAGRKRLPRRFSGCVRTAHPLWWAIFCL
jgi:hypothetical protein